MDNTIQELENLRKELSNLDPAPDNQDFGKLDYLLKKLALFIRRTFGLSSPYLEDLKKVEFPKDAGLSDLSENLKDQSEYEWVTAQDKIDNIFKIMIEDLKISHKDQSTSIQSKKEEKQIFVVHGTEYQPVRELKAIIEELKIKPIILSEQPSKGMTIIEKLETYSKVGFAFIILTPDDLGLTKENLANVFEMPKEEFSMDWVRRFLTEDLDEETSFKYFVKELDLLKDRARQNVILEFGYFIGKLSRQKVCCLYTGNIELPSDMHGVCYLHFNKSVNEIKDAIIEELRAATIITSA